MDQLLINPLKLHEELLAAELPVISVHSDGRIEYSRPLKPTEQAKADHIIAEHKAIALNSIASDQMLLPFL
jgi:hypothetical protein